MLCGGQRRGEYRVQGPPLRTPWYGKGGVTNQLLVVARVGGFFYFG